MMHALHIILETCPENGTLYLALFNVTLDHGLYHESEALLDAILDYAFETSSTSSPRISNHRRFLVGLYSSWTTRFPSSTFVRLVTSALRRASSDNVWTTKATRRLVRKFVRYDLVQQAILLWKKITDQIPFPLLHFVPLFLPFQTFPLVLVGGLAPKLQTSTRNSSTSSAASPRSLHLPFAVQARR